MRKLQIQVRSAAAAALPEKLLNVNVRLVRLAGMSALFGMLAGGEVRIYAQTTEVATIADGPAVLPDETSAPAQPASAADATAVPEPQPEAVYQVLPPELLPTEPTVTVVAQSSVPPENALQAAPAAAAEAGKKGKKKKKEKAPKLTPVHIEQATLTVDGWTGKARLNYDIPDLKYIYVWAPGIGTAVVSNQKFPLGTEQKGAFNGTSLTVQVTGHTIQISSEKNLLKDKKPASAWVYVDSIYKAASRFPQMGYGNTKDAPYVWPGAKDAPVEKGGIVAPPPLPAGMRPTIAKPTCLPAGAASSAGVSPTTTACPAMPARPGTPGSSPAAAPPVPLPGYNSGTTTAEASPAPRVLTAK